MSCAKRKYFKPYLSITTASNFVQDNAKSKHIFVKKNVFRV